MAKDTSSAPAAKGLTYKDAGVDIDAGESAVEGIKDAARRTHRPGVMGGIGGFGGLFALKEAADMVDPVLVSGTDGVGTKLLVAIACEQHDTIGQDLVAMCVNDILTLGAKPLFFLDYFATGKLSPTHMQTVVEGIARACEESDCALLGGETAELPGMYAPGHYDLAGFAVGVVEREGIIDGSAITSGMSVIGLTSSGLHSNGFSLARHVLLEHAGMALDDVVDDKALSAHLLAPTKLYVRPLQKLLDDEAPVLGMAHITGGGLSDNLPRVLPDGIGVDLDVSAWTEPAIFPLIRNAGPVDEQEMRRTFNLGIGMTLVVPSDDASAVVRALREAGEDAAIIGTTTSHAGVRFGGQVS